MLPAEVDSTLLFQFAEGSMQQVGVVRVTPTPRGNDQRPDQESSSRSERRMSKMDSRGRRARTIATAAQVLPNS